MFKFLKEKIKQAVNKIVHRVEEESSLEKSSQKQTQKEKEEIIEKPSIEVQKDLEIAKQIEELEKFDKDAGKKELDKELIVKEVSKTIEKEEKEEKKGFFVKLKEKIVTKKIDETRFNELFWELELALLENNVAVEVIDKIKEDLRKNLVDKPVRRGEVDGIVERSLKKSIGDLFNVEGIDLINVIDTKKEKPYVIVFFGVNGSGKTTTIAKVAHLLKKNNISMVLSASDTFRAASIEQLKEWGTRLNVKVISHNYGADPTAVAFDSMSFCKAHNIDALLIDTAGRLHSNKNLMREMEKIVRVIKPDLKILVAEATVGNDAVNQCVQFDDAVGIDGIILTKSDVDEKGGAIVSISYVTKKPILYLGTGQKYGDLREFDKKDVLKTLGLDF